MTITRYIQTSMNMVWFWLVFYCWQLKLAGSWLHLPVGHYLQSPFSTILGRGDAPTAHRCNFRFHPGTKLLATQSIAANEANRQMQFEQELQETAKVGDWMRAEEVVKQMQLLDIPPTVKIYESLMQSWLQSNHSSKAFEAFDVLQEMMRVKLFPSTACLATLLEELGAAGEIERAEALFHRLQLAMPHVDAELYRALFSAWSKSASVQRFEKIEELVQRMLYLGMPLDRSIAWTLLEQFPQHNSNRTSSNYWTEYQSLASLLSATEKEKILLKILHSCQLEIVATKRTKPVLEVAERAISAVKSIYGINPIPLRFFEILVELFAAIPGDAMLTRMLLLHEEVDSLDLFSPRLQSLLIVRLAKSTDLNHSAKSMELFEELHRNGFMGDLEMYMAMIEMLGRYGRLQDIITRVLQPLCASANSSQTQNDDANRMVRSSKLWNTMLSMVIDFHKQSITVGLSNSATSPAITFIKTALNFAQEQDIKLDPLSLTLILSFFTQETQFEQARLILAQISAADNKPSVPSLYFALINEIQNIQIEGNGSIAHEVIAGMFVELCDLVGSELRSMSDTIFQFQGFNSLRAEFISKDEITVYLSFILDTYERISKLEPISLMSKDCFQSMLRLLSAIPTEAIRVQQLQTKQAPISSIAKEEQNFFYALKLNSPSMSFTSPMWTQADQAMQIFQEMRRRSIDVDTEMYSYLLVCMKRSLKEKSHVIPNRALEILQYMVAQNLEVTDEAIELVLEIWLESRRPDRPRIAESIFEIAMSGESSRNHLPSLKSLKLLVKCWALSIMPSSVKKIEEIYNLMLSEELEIDVEIYEYYVYAMVKSSTKSSTGIIGTKENSIPAKEVVKQIEDLILEVMQKRLPLTKNLLRSLIGTWCWQDQVEGSIDNIQRKVLPVLKHLAGKSKGDGIERESDGSILDALLAMPVNTSINLIHSSLYATITDVLGSRSLVAAKAMMNDVLSNSAGGFTSNLAIPLNLLLESHYKQITLCADANLKEQMIDDLESFFRNVILSLSKGVKNDELNTAEFEFAMKSVETIAMNSVLSAVLQSTREPVYLTLDRFESLVHFCVDEASLQPNFITISRYADLLKSYQPTDLVQRLNKLLNLLPNVSLTASSTSESSSIALESVYYILLDKLSEIKPMECYKILQHMLTLHIIPTSAQFQQLIISSSRWRMTAICEHLYFQMIAFGYKPNAECSHALLFNVLQDSSPNFQGSFVSSSASSSALTVKKLYRRVPSRAVPVVSTNKYLQEDQNVMSLERVYFIFMKILYTGISIDQQLLESFLLILNRIQNISAADMAEKVLMKALKNGMRGTVYLWNLLIAMYAKLSRISMALPNSSNYRNDKKYANNQLQQNRRSSHRIATEFQTTSSAEDLLLEDLIYRSAEDNIFTNGTKAMEALQIVTDFEANDEKGQDDCRNIRKSESLLSTMKQFGSSPDICSYNTVIAAWGKSASKYALVHAMALYHEAIAEDLVPNLVTFTSLMSCISKTAFSKTAYLGMLIFDSIADDFLDNNPEGVRAINFEGAGMLDLDDAVPVPQIAMADEAGVDIVWQRTNAGTRQMKRNTQRRSKLMSNLRPGVLLYTTLFQVLCNTQIPERDYYLQHYYEQMVRPLKLYLSRTNSLKDKVAPSNQEDLRPEQLVQSNPSDESIDSSNWDNLVIPNIVTYTTLLAHYAQSSAANASDIMVMLYRDMIDLQIPPDSVMYSTLFMVLSKRPDDITPYSALDLLSNMQTKHNLLPDTVNWSVVIYIWSNSRILFRERVCQVLFEEMTSSGKCNPSVVTYTNMLKIWTHSNLPEARQRMKGLYEQMCRDQIKLDGVAFNVLLKALNKLYSIPNYEDYVIDENYLSLRNLNLFDSNKFQNHKYKNLISTALSDYANVGSSGNATLKLESSHRVERAGLQEALNQGEAYLKAMMSYNIIPDLVAFKALIAQDLLLYRSDSFASSSTHSTAALFASNNDVSLENCRPWRIYNLLWSLSTSIRLDVETCELITTALSNYMDKRAPQAIETIITNLISDESNNRIQIRELQSEFAQPPKSRVRLTTRLYNSWLISLNRNRKLFVGEAEQGMVASAVRRIVDLMSASSTDSFSSMDYITLKNINCVLALCQNDPAADAKTLQRDVVDYVEGLLIKWLRGNPINTSHGKTIRSQLLSDIDMLNDMMLLWQKVLVVNGNDSNNLRNDQSVKKWRVVAKDTTVFQLSVYKAIRLMQFRVRDGGPITEDKRFDVPLFKELFGDDYTDQSDGERYILPVNKGSFDRFYYTLSKAIVASDGVVSMLTEETFFSAIKQVTKSFGNFLRREYPSIANHLQFLLNNHIQNRVINFRDEANLRLNSLDLKVNIRIFQSIATLTNSHRKFQYLPQILLRALEGMD